MDKKQSLVSSKKLLLLQRTCATLVLQNFYRQYIKCERDDDGNPIDPIMREGFDSKNQIKILYKTRVKGSQRVITKLLIYNIETLFESIKSSGNAINPLTNTKFNHAHFTQILNKAVERKVIKENDMNSYLKKYGYDKVSTGLKCSCCSDENVSSYEPIDSEIEKNSILLERDQNLLTYYTLLNDITRVERLVYKNLGNIDKNTFNIDFIRDPKNKIPEIPDSSSYNGIMRNLNRICDKYNQKKNKKKPLIKKKPLVKKRGTQQEEIKTIVEINKIDKLQIDADEKEDELKIDSDLELSLLPEYLKHGYSALQVCCYHGNISMLLFLLQFGGDLSRYDQKTKLLPLHIALLEKQIPLLQTLVIYGVTEQLNFESEYGTAMEMASKLVGEFPEVYSVLFGATEIVI